jgi:NADH-quinone oxidoreductase subunit G
MVTVKINGREITVDDNTLILEAARDAGYEIPTFCYQADLMGIGSCRMCLVEIEGQKKLQPSCVTPVLHGMSILTETPAVANARAGVLEFLLANHALDCPVCDKAGECELQDMVYRYGPRAGRHEEPKFKFHDKDYALSPVIIKNSNRCVQCMKCVRVCREVVGANVLGALGRGDHQEPTSFMRSRLDCDHCGNCIEVCPVGCFMRLPYRYKSRPWDLKGADTVCPYCATGCRMVLEERDGSLVRARAQLGVGLNSETLCARGRFGFDYMGNTERLKTPLVRRYGRLEPATWEEALGVIKENLGKDNPGGLDGKRVGGIASARLTNEEIFLFQRLVRGALGSPNIDSGSRWPASSAEAFIEAVEMPLGGVSVYDCMAADTVVVIGSHLSDENPVTDYIVRRISASRRMGVVIASPRAMKLDSSATLRLRHQPAAEGALLAAAALAMSAEAPDKMPQDGQAVRDMWAAPRGLGPEALLGIAGVSAKDAAALARTLKASASVGIIAGTGFLRFHEGASGLGMLKVVLRALGKKVMVVPALDRCNQRGAWEMGAHPAFGPAYAAAPERGLGTWGMLDAAREGTLDALYVAGEDVVSMYPDEVYAREAVAKLKFLVVQDIFLTETARLAHVVLPGAAPGEKDGTFTNQEGRVQAIKGLLPPPGKARRDMEIIGAVGALLDPAFARYGAAAAFGEIRREAGTYREVSLAFDNRRNIANRLDLKEALVKGAGAWAPRAASPSLRAPGAGRGGDEAGYPFKLITGNHLFHSGTLSRRSESLTGLLKGAVVEISEEDALALGLSPGAKVKVSCAHHEALMTLMTGKGSARGVAFIAENFEDVSVNRFLKRGAPVPRVSITAL